MIILHNKDQIKSSLQHDVFLHIYSLGDLDDFFWKYTQWYAAEDRGEINTVVLLYVGQPLPVILALSRDTKAMQNLLSSIQHLLPQRFYAHLSPGVEAAFKDHYQLDHINPHFKMGLTDPSRLKSVDTSGVVQLSMNDIDAILELYKTSYPGNWFDPRMLETGQYFGIKGVGQVANLSEHHRQAGHLTQVEKSLFSGEDGLLSIAGVHVYSRQYKVAALGNITTHPEHRGRGLGKAVTAALCQSLLASVDHIGLNVKADNHGAIALYKKLGFEVICSYNEMMVESK